MRRRFAPHVLALAVALAATGAAAAAPSAPADTAGASATTLSSASAARAATLEVGIVRELNRVRSQFGLPSLKVSPGLTQAALGHSTGMLRSGLFAHNSADGTSFDRRVLRSYPTKGFSSWTVGENLLFDSGELDAAGAVQAWMDSPPHRENMLNAAFREVGVGALQSIEGHGDFGEGPVTVVTLDFGARTLTKVRVGSARR